MKKEETLSFSTFKLMPLSPSFSSLIIILIATLLAVAYSQEATKPPSTTTSYVNCNRTFSCGSIRNITYPFTGSDRPSYCGLPEFMLTCRDNTITEFTSNSITYRVLQLDQTQKTMILSRSDLYNNTCTTDFRNSTLNSTLFDDEGMENEVLNLIYGCNSSAMTLRPHNLFSCNSSGFDLINAYYLIGPVPNDPILSIIYCNVSISVPILRAASDRLTGLRISLEEALMQGFSVNYSDPYESNCSECNRLSGQCGFDSGLGQPVCICGIRPCPPNDSVPSEGNDNSNKTGMNVGLSIAGAVLAGWLRLGLQLNELEEATNNFDPSKELGDGGFGTVYYGVLADGRVVAVKRLYENNFKRVEQFMNEVEILTRLRHKNLVTLYGCTSKRSRELLLVYEYIPNGTVADHLHGNRANSGLLSWTVRLNIAIETAEALAYLHKSDIIHRDVKTNNILLDNDFHVKVADFGLSRLFPNDVTHVSTAPQGTPGYVDPEYYQCYQLTEKSDVYSFGVVLIELISSLQAVDTNRHRHDINLANMAVNKIQNHTLHELVDTSLGFEANSIVRRMATLVAELAFRCLQQERDMRPSMEEVLEVLRGIQNGNLNAHKVEVVDILIDDEVGPLKGSVDPSSPDSVVPGKWVSTSTPNSSE
ncbi:putative serine/threonine-protein kinase [Abeliophyllum distichum]|uniref:non-specific serine/threonine protein kinase n=1 Tax=Abeliophyllum distichum TaxID=126358 RepID=A0ABD1NQJ8_9LAMI